MIDLENFKKEDFLLGLTGGQEVVACWISGSRGLKMQDDQSDTDLIILLRNPKEIGEPISASATKETTGVHWFFYDLKRLLFFQYGGLWAESLSDPCNILYQNPRYKAQIDQIYGLRREIGELNRQLFALDRSRQLQRIFSKGIKSSCSKTLYYWYLTASLSLGEEIDRELALAIKRRKVEAITNKQIEEISSRLERFYLKATLSTREKLVEVGNQLLEKLSK